MCGIAGLFHFDRARAAPEALARAMAQALSHRGPDAHGSHADGPAALGHARLSIIDLRPEANQPMLSADGEVAIAFNGEIYNFQQLGRELQREGVTLRTRSDTEVILELYRQRGLDFVSALRGMFAIAIWDRRAQRLVLARDRVGQKPLFYYQDAEHLSFASEVRALLCDERVTPRVDTEGLSLYLSLGYVPSCASAFDGIKKVQPGCMLVVDANGVREHRYWKLEYGPARRLPVADEVRTLREKLADAVRARMISDVPLGAFLSGGLDSSTIVAMMAQASDRPVKTFSIGFDDADYSELEHARAVAEHYRTEHYEEVVRPDAVALLPMLVQQYGEPFADPSAVPTYCLSRMTRQHVTVALSGDGADETFAGYTRYAH
ncbi:MAG: asparagine synthase (glutamine-hydrolyzing), partial [Myxococcales bacterium]|nr:asparagine synthase (glutamine-hydrolyzing) [Myxococcales bacterium]